MVLGIFDQDVSDKVAEKFPQLYYQGHNNIFFNIRTFISYTLNSLLHCAICFFIPYYAMSFSSQIGLGQQMDMLGTGITVYSSVLLTVTVKCMLETSSWSVLFVLSLLFSIISWFIFVLIYGSLYYIPTGLFFLSNEYYEILQEWRVFGTAQFWFVMFVTVAVAIGRDFIYKCWIRMSSNDIYYAIQKFGAKVTDRDALLSQYPWKKKYVKKPKMVKKKVIFDDIRQFFATVTDALKLQTYTGFAFAQTEGQEGFIEIQTAKDGKESLKRHYTMKQLKREAERAKEESQESSEVVEMRIQ
jgi:magnesium-transporting ATPase (P-type)